MMSVQTRSQKLSQAAYLQVDKRQITDKYITIAKKFPALIHVCGLAQAVAFGVAKKEHHEYLDDLAAVLQSLGYDLDSRYSLDNCSRSAGLDQYLRLSRDAISAAGWLKRYVEAFSPDSQEENE